MKLVDFRRVRFDHCKACRRLVEVRIVRFELCKECRILEVLWVCFDFRKACRRLAEVWRVGLTTVKYVGDLKIDEYVFTTGNVLRVYFAFRNACEDWRWSEMIGVTVLSSTKCVRGLWMLCGSQNRLIESPTRFGAVKTASPNFHKPPICFAVVKTDSLNL